MERKLLLISHEADRTGAPLVLLSFCRWLHEHSEFAFEILLLHDGPLRVEFERLAPTFLADRLSRKHSRLHRLSHRLLRRDDEHWSSRAAAALAGRNYTTIYGNSVVTLEWLSALQQHSAARCICGVHELSWVITQFFSHADASRRLAGMDSLIAFGRTVAVNLEQDLGIEAARIRVLDPFMETDAPLKLDREEIRKSLSIEPGEFVIGGSGSANFRKGVDLLLPLCKLLADSHPSLRFKMVWLGGRATDEIVSLTRHDAKRLGLDDRLVFVETTPYPDDYIGLYDVFILLSREEPMGMVALSAALQGKPIVAFQGSGGMDEFLGEGAGRLVPYLNLREFANAILDLQQDPARAGAMGKIGAARVSRHHAAAQQCAKFYDLVFELRADAGTATSSPAEQFVPLEDRA